MQISYLVHDVRNTSVVLPMTNGDETLDATVPAVEVELVPLSHKAAGTVKLSYVGGEAAQAKVAFVKGNQVQVSWGDIPGTYQNINSTSE